MKEIQKQLKKRQWGEVIRLEIEDRHGYRRLLKILKKELHSQRATISSTIGGPLDLTFLMKMYGMEGFDHLKTPGYTPQPVPALMNDDDIFTNIRKRRYPAACIPMRPSIRWWISSSRRRRIRMCWPSSRPFTGSAAIPRSSRLWLQAAENGKQVSVLVELKARFDEENNIIWAKMLEKAGCHVIYGLVGLKTHSKITLVVRREEDGIRRYVHLGTGNYNDSTAKLYTDCGIMTCNPSRSARMPRQSSICCPVIPSP